MLYVLRLKVSAVFCSGQYVGEKDTPQFFFFSSYNNLRFLTKFGKNVHADVLRLHAVYKLLKRYITKCCEWTKYFPLKEKFCPGYGKISPPTERLLMLSIYVSRRDVVLCLVKDVFYL